MMLAYQRAEYHVTEHHCLNCEHHDNLTSNKDSQKEKKIQKEEVKIGFPRISNGNVQICRHNQIWHTSPLEVNA
jgi:Zn ribbon nucleic-acid-binding protein